MPKDDTTYDAVHARLIEAAARAVEEFGEDILEKFAEQARTYRVDIERADSVKWANYSGVYVRAFCEGRGWDAYDIATLEPKSLLRFLRCKGGHNVWAEDIVGIVFNRGRIASDELQRMINDNPTI